MKRLLPIILLFVGFSVSAQQSLPAGQNYYDDGPTGIVYNREMTFDARLLTPRSFGIGVTVGQIRTYYQTRYWAFSFEELRHPMEDRQPANQLISVRVARPFIFGKQNNVYLLKAGWGGKRYLSEKAKHRGLAIGYSYQVGPTLAILKPYYLGLYRSVDPGTDRFFVSDERFSATNATDFLDIGLIAGASSFSEGLGEVSVMPGLHARAAIHFDWGAFDEIVKAMEAGISLDVFGRDVPIMAEHPSVPHLENSPVFINLFLNLQLGKRW